MKTVCLQFLLCLTACLSSRLLLIYCPTFKYQVLSHGSVAHRGSVVGWSRLRY
jgi:hypothetical protein